jgi:hypothetical protein
MNPEIPISSSSSLLEISQDISAGPLEIPATIRAHKPADIAYTTANLLHVEAWPNSAGSMHTATAHPSTASDSVGTTVPTFQANPDYNGTSSSVS